MLCRIEIEKGETRGKKEREKSRSSRDVPSSLLSSLHQTHLLQSHQPSDQPRIRTPDLALPQLQTQLDNRRMNIALHRRRDTRTRFGSREMRDDQMRRRSGGLELRK